MTTGGGPLISFVHPIEPAEIAAYAAVAASDCGPNGTICAGETVGDRHLDEDDALPHISVPKEPYPQTQDLL